MNPGIKLLLISFGILMAMFGAVYLIIRLAGIEMNIPYTKKWWEEWRKNQ